MGWLDLFKKDPAALLERAERRLADDDPVGALELIGRLVRHRDPQIRDRASGLGMRARDSLVSATLARASAAEAAGGFEDAADWLEAALQHVRDGAQRAELQVRLEQLEARAAAAAAAPTYGEREEVAAEEPDFELSLEDHYSMLVDTLEERMTRRYEGRSPEFQRAYVDLNEGHAEAALAALEELVARDPRDPVLRFERGRCRLMLGQAAGAREDFEASWHAFGDDPVDLAGNLTLPGLWAEAMLALGEPGTVLERLRELADPDTGNPDLTYLFAQALLAAGRFGEARSLLATAAALFPSRQDFPHALAAVLARMGEPEQAIRCLETAIAPSCATGNCARPPLHLPSLRTLAGLYLERGGAGDRVHELMLWIAQAQGGRLAAEDYLLLAAYHRQQGDHEAAAEAVAKARRLGLKERGGSGKAPDPTLGAGRTVL